MICPTCKIKCNYICPSCGESVTSPWHLTKDAKIFSEKMRSKAATVELKWESVTVESKEHKLERPDYTFPYPFIWRLERFIRKIINKPAKMVPVKFVVEEPKCFSAVPYETMIEDLTKL